MATNQPPQVFLGFITTKDNVYSSSERYFMIKGRSIVARKGGSRQRAYKCDQWKQDCTACIRWTKQAQGGWKVSSLDDTRTAQLRVVEGRYLPPALRLLGPANAGRATLLPMITLTGALPTATFARHNGAPLGHEKTLGARVDIILCCDEAQKDLGWLVCRHHDGVGAGVLSLLVRGRRYCHSFKQIERSREPCHLAERAGRSLYLLCKKRRSEFLCL